MKDLLGGKRDDLPAQRDDGGRGYMFPSVQLSVVLLLVAVYPTHFPPLTTHQHIVDTIRLLDLILHRDKQLFATMNGQNRRHSRELPGVVTPCVDEHSDTCVDHTREDHVTQRPARRRDTDWRETRACATRAPPPALRNSAQNTAFPAAPDVRGSEPGRRLSYPRLIAVLLPRDSVPGRTLIFYCNELVDVFCVCACPTRKFGLDWKTYATS